MDKGLPAGKLSKSPLRSRAIAIALAAATAIAMFPAQGFAAEGVEAQSSMPSASTQAQVTDKSSLAQALLEEGGSVGQAEINLRGFGVSLGDFRAAIKSVMGNPWFYYCFAFGYSYNETEVISAKLAGSPGETEAISSQEEIFESLIEVLGWIDDNMSDEEKAQAAHDYLVRKCAYGYNGSDNKHNAYGALVEHSPVCEGYSKAYKLILDELGIPCIVVNSASMNHAWNMVQIDGDWYHVDVTWDDPTVNGSDQGFSAPVRHDYFLKSDASMRNDHYGWETSHTASKNSPYIAGSHRFSSPVQNLAPETGWEESGTCEWKVDDAGTLTIKPLPGLNVGRLAPWQKGNEPWVSKAKAVKRLIVSSRVNTFLSGASLLKGLSELETMDISGVNSSGILLAKGMLADCKKLSQVTLGHGQQLALDELLSAKISKTWVDQATSKRYSPGDQLPDAASLTLVAADAKPGKPDDGAAEPKTQSITTSKTGTIATVSAKALKKKAVKVAWGCRAKTTLSYKKASGDKKIAVNAKTGSITLKKSLKKGNYALKVEVQAKKTASYEAASATFILKVKVK